MTCATQRLVRPSRERSQRPAQGGPSLYEMAYNDRASDFFDDHGISRRSENYVSSRSWSVRILKFFKAMGLRK